MLEVKYSQGNSWVNADNIMLEARLEMNITVLINL